MTKKLTTFSIKNAKAPVKRKETPDGACRGLYLVHQPSGHVSFAVRFRFGGKPKKLTLQATELADARVEATAALKKVAKGVDPSLEKQTTRKAAKAAKADAAADSVENVAAQFIAHLEHKKNRSVKQVHRYFEREILPKWRGRSVHSILRDDVEHLVDRVATDRPVAANRLRSVLHHWFAWMLGRWKGGRKAVLAVRLAANPVVGVESPGAESARDRVLSPAEIRLLWDACDKIGEPYGPCIKLMLLTGQRRGEVSGMRWSEMDGNVWTIPAERAKNKLIHLVPLPTQAMALLKRRRWAGDYVFSATAGKQPITSFSRVREALAAAGMTDDPPWVLHDLRRTAATGMAGIGILPVVIEATLNHISGSSRSGVAGIYNRHSYQAEKAAALQKWADRVEKIVGGNAVALQAAE